MGWNPVAMFSKTLRDIIHSTERTETRWLVLFCGIKDKSWNPGQMMKMWTHCLSHPTALFSHSYDSNMEEQHFG